MKTGPRDSVQVVLVNAAWEQLRLDAVRRRMADRGEDHAQIHWYFDGRGLSVETCVPELNGMVIAAHVHRCDR